MITTIHTPHLKNSFNFASKNLSCNIPVAEKPQNRSEEEFENTRELYWRVTNISKQKKIIHPGAFWIHATRTEIENYQVKLFSGEEMSCEQLCGT